MSKALLLSRSFALRMVVIALAGLASWALACGDDAGTQPAAPSGTGAEAERPDAAEPSSRQAPPPARRPAEPAVTEGSLPEGYPSDLPVYPDASPGMSLSMPGAALLVTWTSEDSAEEVLAFYRRELASAGWKVRETREGSLAATKGSRQANVSVDDTDEGSEIGMSVTDE